MKNISPAKVLNPFFNMLYYAIFFIAICIVWILYPMRVIGKEHIIKKGGFVLAPNHWRALDPLFVVLARGFAKKILVMAKEDLINKNIFLDFFCCIAGAFPVQRGKGDMGTVTTAVEFVKKGRGILIFPEGTRSGNGVINRFKSGAFVVAHMAGVPIQPCRIWYKAGKVKMFSRATIIFGAPITTAELGIPEDYKPSDLREAKRRYLEILNKLYDDNKDRL